MKIKILTRIILATIYLFIAISAAMAEGYRLGPEDILNISVHEQDDLTSIARVTSDGDISFPLLGTVNVSGMTVREVEARITELLAADYLVNPQVTVNVEEYSAKQVSVIGSVNEPGKYDLYHERDTTVLEAIAMANGFNEDAAVNKTTVLRVEDGEEQTFIIKVDDITKRGKKDKDMVLKPNDIIFVPESFF